MRFHLVILPMAILIWQCNGLLIEGKNKANNDNRQNNVVIKQKNSEESADLKSIDSDVFIILTEGSENSLQVSPGEEKSLEDLAKTMELDPTKLIPASRPFDVHSLDFEAIDLDQFIIKISYEAEQLSLQSESEIMLFHLPMDSTQEWQIFSGEQLIHEPGYVSVKTRSLGWYQLASYQHVGSPISISLAESSIRIALEKERVSNQSELVVPISSNQGQYYSRLVLRAPLTCPDILPANPRPFEEFAIFKFESEANYTICLQSQDILGNPIEKPTFFSWTFDLTPPSALQTIDATRNGNNGEVQIILRRENNLPDIAFIKVYALETIDDTEVDCTSAALFEIPQEDIFEEIILRDSRPEFARYAICQLDMAGNHRIQFSNTLRSSDLATENPEEGDEIEAAAICQISLMGSLFLLKTNTDSSSQEIFLRPNAPCQDVATECANAFRNMCSGDPSCQSSQCFYQATTDAQGVTLGTPGEKRQVILGAP